MGERGGGRGGGRGERGRERRREGGRDQSHFPKCIFFWGIPEWGGGCNIIPIMVYIIIIELTFQILLLAPPPTCTISLNASSASHNGRGHTSLAVSLHCLMCDGLVQVYVTFPTTRMACT